MLVPARELVLECQMGRRLLAREQEQALVLVPARVPSALGPARGLVPGFQTDHPQPEPAQEPVRVLGPEQVRACRTDRQQPVRAQAPERARVLAQELVLVPEQVFQTDHPQ